MAQFIQIAVRLTGKAAEIAGEAMLDYALVPPARLDTLLELVGTRRPVLVRILDSCSITINGADVDRSALLSDGDEVAILAPD